MMQTAADTNHNTNTNTTTTTLGDCARLLLLAPEEGGVGLLQAADDGEAQLSPAIDTFEALLARLRQRALVAAADRLFAAFVATAEARHY
jgi:hypothetical protein